CQRKHPAEMLALGSSCASHRRSSNANSLCGRNSAGSRKSVRSFKGIFCHDISEFESYMPSQPVRSPPACHRVVKRVRYFVQVYQDIVITDDWGLEDALGILQFVLVLLVASIPVAMPAGFSIPMRLG